MATWTDYKTYFPSGLGDMVDDLETLLSETPFDTFSLYHSEKIKGLVEDDGGGPDYVNSLATWIDGLKSGNNSFPDILDEVSNSSFPEDHDYLEEFFTMPGDWEDFNNNWTEGTIATEISNNATDDFWKYFAECLFERKNNMMDSPFTAFLDEDAFEEKTADQSDAEGEDLINPLVEGHTKEEIRQLLHCLHINEAIPDIRDTVAVIDGPWEEWFDNFNDDNSFLYSIAKNIHEGANAFYGQNPSNELENFPLLHNPHKQDAFQHLFGLLEVGSLTELKDKTIDEINAQLTESTTTHEAERVIFLDHYIHYHRNVIEYVVSKILVPYSALVQLKDGLGNELDGFKVEFYDENINPGTPYLISAGFTTGEGYVEMGFTVLEEISSTYDLDLKIYNPKNELITDAESISFDPEQTDAYLKQITYFGVTPPTTELDTILTSYEHTLDGAAATNLGPFITTLRSANTTLREIRMAGGVRGMSGYQDSWYTSLDSNEKEEFDKYINHIDSHANLELLSNDFDALELIIDNEGANWYSINLVQIAIIDRETFIDANYQLSGLDEFKCGEIHQKAVDIKKFLDNVLAGSYASRGVAINIDPDPLLPDLPESNKCRDSESAVSPLAYLSELMNYAINHVYEYDDGTQTVTSIDLDFLESKFHQPFSDLPASGDEMENIICQSRVNVEVLTSYVEPIQGTDQTNQFNSSYRKYLKGVYFLLLENLGTTYQELRSSRTLPEENRIKYASKLGITLDTQNDQLEEMLFDLDEISDDDLNKELEIVFGFRRYNRPAIGDDPNDATNPTQPEPKLKTWRTEYLRDLWLSLDYPADPFTNDEFPIIDPDLITPDDFRNPLPSGGTGNNDSVFDLWIKRRKWVDGIIADFESKTMNKGIFSDLQAIVLYGENRLAEFIPLIGKSDSIEIDGHTYTPATVKLVESDTMIVFEESLDASLTIGDTLKADTSLQVVKVEDSGGSNFNLIDITSENLTAIFVDDFTFTYIDPSNTEHSCTVSSSGSSHSDGVLNVTIDENLGSAFSGGTVTYKKAITTIDGKDAMDLAGMFTHIQTASNFTYNSEDYSPWDPTKDESDFKGIMAGLQSNNPVSVDAAKSDLELFNLTQAEFSRLYELYQKDNNANYSPEDEAVTDTEWDEVISILTQSVKKVYYADWISEEDTFISDPITLNAIDFWLPVREPKEGKWPVNKESGIPLIDPEKIDTKELPDITLGKGRVADGAIDLFNSRVLILQTNYETIKSEHESGGFNGMFDECLGSTVPQSFSTWEDFLDDIHIRLEGVAQDDILSATTDIRDELLMTIEDFEALYATLEKSRKKDPSEQPTNDEWNNTYRIMTSAHKVNNEYTGTDKWEEKEDDLLNPDEDPFFQNHYWNLRKAFLPKWRADKSMRLKWQVALLNRSRPPYIDPDLMGPVDIARTGNEDMVWEIWNNRYDFIHDENASPQGHMARIKGDRENDEASQSPTYTKLEQFDRRIVAELLDMSDEPDTLNEFFTEIYDYIYSGKNVNRRLRQLNITFEEFMDLWKVRELAEAQATILESEWQILYAILTAAHKRRQHSFWRDEEISYTFESNEYNITLSQDFFRVPGPKPVEYPPKEEDELPMYLADDRNKKYWQDKVESRIEQENTMLNGVDEAVRETEKVMLFKIRDALVMATGDYTPDESALRLKAKLLTDSLLIDCKTLCCQETTRLSMAIECIQGLLWSIRTGQWETDPLHLKLWGTTFDKDWEWIGSYQPWRSAMFVHIYPENILIPSLRKHQSGAFRELVKATADNGRLDPKQACEAAEEYEVYFKDVANLEVKSTCMVREGLKSESCSTSSGNLFNHNLFMFSISEKSQKVYWCKHNDKGPKGYKQSPWEHLKAFKKVIDIVGSQAIEDKSKERFIVLVAKILVKGREELTVARYNINKAKWDEEANQLETIRPLNCRTFKATMVQTFSDKLPPQVVLQAGMGGQTQVYANQMNSEGTAWASDEWSTLLTQQKVTENETWKQLLSAVEIDQYIEHGVRKREYMLVMGSARPTGQEKLYYRIFGRYDDGKLAEIGRQSAFIGAVPVQNSSGINNVHIFYKNENGVEKQKVIERVPDSLSSQINTSPESTISLQATEIMNNFKELILDIAGIDIEEIMVTDEFGEGIWTKSDNEKYVINITNLKNAGKSAIELLKETSTPNVHTYEAEGMVWWVKWAVAGTLKERIDLGYDDIEGQAWASVQDSLGDCIENGDHHIHWFAYNFFDENRVIKRKQRDDSITEVNGFPRWTNMATKFGDDSYYANGPLAVNIKMSGSSTTNVWKYKLKVDANDALIEDTAHDNFREMCNPYLVSPTEISGSFSKQQLQTRKTQITATMKLNNSIPAMNYEYLAEAYYFVPMQIALSLTSKGHYKEALDWFRSIYDYSQPDNDTPGEVNKRKIYYGLEREEIYGKNFNRSNDWMQDPLNPHSIASTRPYAYTKFTIMNLVKCLQAYADSEYTEDTAESVPRARTLYQTANELISLLLPESNEEVLIGLTVTTEDRFLKPRWEELKRKITDIKPKSAAEQAVSDVNSLELVEENEIGSLTEMLAAEDAVQDVIDAQVTEDSFSDTLTSRVSNQSSLASVALTNGAVDSAMVSITANASNQFSNAVSTVTGFSASAMQTNGATIPFLRGSSTATPTQSSLVDSNIASYRSSSIAAPSAEGNWIRGLNDNPAESVGGMTAEASGYIPSPDYTFCIPENPVFASLRFKSELNLFKIRTCRNIAGMKRQIDPFAAPTDTSSGMPVIGPGGQLVLPGNTKLQPTPYRYQVLINRAKELVNIAQQIESNFFAALEKIDAEKYGKMKAKQDMKLAKATVRLQDLRVKEAESSVALSEKQVERAKFQADHFANLISAGISELESEAIGHLVSSSDLQMTSQVIQQTAVAGYAAATVAASIDATSNTANLYAANDTAAPLQIGIQTLQAEAGALSTLAGYKSTLSSIASQRASFERRQEEWGFQKGLAGQDIGISKQQVKIAKDHVRVVGQERKIAQMQSEFAQETMEFLSNKFTNEALYRWMSNILEGVYSYFLQEATSIAALAQSQLAFERQQVPPPFIQGDYWSVPTLPGAQEDDKRGLTGSVRLLQDIHKLDQYAFGTDERKMQLSKTISLANMAPVEFQKFRGTGILGFHTPQELFDRDFPGHYMRLIKKVKVSVIGLISPVDGIKATLTSSGITRTIIGGDIFQETVIRRDPEVIPLTSPKDATGMFEMSPDSEKFLNPFESTGVDGFWEFRMERASNFFDFDGIGDILMTIEYEALNSFDYRARVINELGTDYSGTIAYSFKRNFSDTWFDLINQSEEEGRTALSAIFNTFFSEFPINVRDPQISQVTLFFVLDTRVRHNPTVSLSFKHYGEEDWLIKPGEEGGEATAIDGLISTRKGNASSWLAILDSSPVEGTWTLNISDVMTRRMFAEGSIKDMLFAVTYKGELPPYNL